MATLTPTGGKTWCTVTGGAFGYTYDGYTWRACEFKDSTQSCISEWYWNTAVNVTAMNFFSWNYHEHAYMYAIYGRVNGSWVKIVSGVHIHSTHNSWVKHRFNCDNCTGIRIITQHVPNVPRPTIGEVSFDYVTAPPPPPPPEGKAVITNVARPETFEPNKQFTVSVTIRNDGDDDYFFVRILNRYTNQNLSEIRLHLTPGSSYTTAHRITLAQKTAFSGRVEAGHEED